MSRHAKLAATLAALMLVAAPVVAHDGHRHEAAPDPAPEMKTAALQNTPGFPKIKGGDFTLLDQHGMQRTSRDPQGRYQLVFFGYASCQAICSVALPRMAEAVDALEAIGKVVTPVLITVDPARDTVATIGPAAAKFHPRLVGLTGDDAALSAAYKAFNIERKLVFEHPDYGPVYAHGSYIYLLAPDGKFLTLLPPVLGPERIAEVAEGYMK